MSTPAVDLFIANLRRSTLLSPTGRDHVEHWLQHSEGNSDPRQLANELMDRLWLTPWQAGMLLTGHDAFFLGRYKLLDQLGEGGMGTVFKAEQTPLGRIVALKVMAPALLQDPSAVARFHREIQAAAALSHPNVVTAFDAESVKDTHFLVMEYIAGKDLNHYAAGNRALALGWACECIRQAALGLQHAHERGLVHRDLKPGNLLVTAPVAGIATGGQPAHHAADAQPSVKILDMGLSRFVSETTQEGGLTGVGQVMGTPDYISPEQARDTHAADIRSDIYSLGCTLFRLLTGRVPFEGNTVVKKLLARTTHDAPRLASLRPDVPPALDAVVAQMLARDPARRYQTPVEVARALAPFCGSLTSVPLAEITTPITPAVLQREVERTSVFESTHPTLNKFLNTLAHCAITEPYATNTPSDAAGAARYETMDLSSRPSPTAATTRLAPSRRLRRRAAVWMTIALVVACTVVGAGWLVFAGGTIILDWNPAEREGGKLTIDDRPVPIVANGPIRIAVRPGKYRVNLIRPGYVPLEFAPEIKRRTETSLKIDWQPTLGTRRRQEWQALEGKLSPSQESDRKLRPPADSSRVARLHAFRRRWPGTDEGLAAARELARLEWPLDRLAATDLSDRERFAWHPPELVAVFGETGPAHSELVQMVVYRPDGAQVASCGGDGLIRLWDAATMQQQAEIPRSTRVLAYTADSRFLIAGGPGAVFYNVTGPAPVEEFAIPNLDGPVNAIVVSPDSRTLALIDTQIRLFDLTASPPTAYCALATDSWASGAAFTPDSRTLVTFSAEKSLKLWNLRGREAPELRPRLESPTLNGPSDHICGVVISADGKHMVSAGVWDYLLYTWDLTGRLTADLQATPPGVPAGYHHTSAPSVINRSSDGKLFAVGSWDGTVSLFDFTTGAAPPIISMPGHTAQVWGAAFSRWQATGYRRQRRGPARLEHRRGQLARARTPARRTPAPGFRSLVQPGRHRTVFDGPRRQDHRVGRGQPSATPRTDADRRPDSGVGPQSRWPAAGGGRSSTGGLASCRCDDRRDSLHVARHALAGYLPVQPRRQADRGTRRRHDSFVERVGPERAAQSRGLPPACLRISFFPDGKTLVAGNNTAEYAPPATADVQQWDIATGDQLQQFAGDKAGGDKAGIGVNAIDCSPDGKTVAVAVQPTGLILWDVTGKAPRCTFVAGQAITALAFSPDGKQLFTLAALSSVVTLRHPQTGAELKSWRLASQPHSLTVAPDSRHVALGNANGTICILRID